ncbi:hypothetical protein NEOLEDRAFT_40175 [Neolentinus lepideus HHB14362 ss-1]|uniref:Uncharacterized protein n=1 Tax=Neolentinus lepideus HHB14362 ss-1 TaxID=1314782 RepID=A0A165W8J4_9AGAM|nr:hypothetical protein NEOLEDRAFT_40175 [Neolentinus lepideus HHB14362 ss-1]
MMSSGSSPVRSTSSSSPRRSPTDVRVGGSGHDLYVGSQGASLGRVPSSRKIAPLPRRSPAVLSQLPAVLTPRANPLDVSYLAGKSSDGPSARYFPMSDTRSSSPISSVESSSRNVSRRSSPSSDDDDDSYIPSTPFQQHHELSPVTWDPFAITGSPVLSDLFSDRSPPAKGLQLNLGGVDANMMPFHGCERPLACDDYAFLDRRKLLHLHTDFA